MKTTTKRIEDSMTGKNETWGIINISLGILLITLNAINGIDTYAYVIGSACIAVGIMTWRHKMF